MSFGMRLRAVFIVLVAAFVAWTYMHGRADVREMRDPKFSTPTPPAFAEISAASGDLVLDGRLRTSAGSGLGDASVVVNADGIPHWTRTDATGRFRIGGLPAGEHDLCVLAFDERPQTFRVRVPADDIVEIALAAPNPPLATLPETSRKTLRGTLVAAADVACEGTEIWLEPPPGTDPLTGVLPRRARADTQGRFVIEQLALGSYEVRMLPAWASGGGWPALDRTEFTWTGVEQELRLEFRPASVRLELVDASSSPLTGVLALLHEAGNAQRGWPSTTSDAAGRLVFRDLAPGEYELELIAGKARELRAFRVGAAERVDLGTLVLAP